MNLLIEEVKEEKSLLSGWWWYSESESGREMLKRSFVGEEAADVDAEADCERDREEEAPEDEAVADERNGIESVARSVFGQVVVVVVVVDRPGLCGENLVMGISF